MNQPFSIGLIAVLGVSLLSACSGLNTMHGSQANASLEIPNAPIALRAPPGQLLTLVAKATGVQIYACVVSQNDPSKFEWKFKAPEAILFNAQGNEIGKHYGGPTWEGVDGSKVVGQVKASNSDSDPNSISSLLLNAVGHSGSGVFTKTSTIQRLYPVGGKAPMGGCDQDHLGQEARVSYTAQYYFYD